MNTFALTQMRRCVSKPFVQRNGMRVISLQFNRCVEPHGLGFRSFSHMFAATDF